MNAYRVTYMLKSAGYDRPLAGYFLARDAWDAVRVARFHYFGVVVLSSVQVPT